MLRGSHGDALSGMFEFPATHCQPVQIEAVASFAIGRAAVQLLLGAQYVIFPMDDGTLVILRRDAAVWWDDQPTLVGSCAGA